MGLEEKTLRRKIDLLVLELGKHLSDDLESQGVPIVSQLIKVKLRLCYQNTDTVLMLDYCAHQAAAIRGLTLHDLDQTEVVDPDPNHKFVSEFLPPVPSNRIGRSLSSLREEFLTTHHQQFGFCLPEDHLINISSVEIEATSQGDKALTDWKIEIIKDSKDSNGEANGKNNGSCHEESNNGTTIKGKRCKTFLHGNWVEATLVDLTETVTPNEFDGPAILVDQIGTNVVLPGWKASLDANRCLFLTASEHECNKERSKPSNLTVADPFWLELFNHYFQTISQEMGAILQRTCQSINIKERLDFSCAVFDSHGRLIANAPHIPVHLGSMGKSVESLIRSKNNHFISGQVFISNNPFNGGTHLPDITAITPVFLTDEQQHGNSLIAFVASRGHHADIGGKTPGSMPAMSCTLEEEGVVFDNMLIVDPDSGGFLLHNVLAALSSGKYPARNPQLNIADLQAQIAANRRGVEELRKAVKSFGLDAVQAYMGHVLDGGERAARCVIKKLYLEDSSGDPMKPGRSIKEKTFTCCMDGGSEICVKVEIEGEEISIDFSGSSETDPMNYNAPLSVLHAAVLYVFRTLIKDCSIPLNEGCMRPLKIKVPYNCIVNPREGSAVAAGNVEISQCAVNALYGCLGQLAASQGTMNNITFGNSAFQYYETLGGGTGAGDGFNGCSAIQSHMTNSRITDVELLESRFPVVVLEFSIRPNTGGQGKYRGGDGLKRTLLFLEEVECSILSGMFFDWFSELVRYFRPTGNRAIWFVGGLNGSPGLNRLFVNSIAEKQERDLNEIRERLPMLESTIRVLKSRETFQISAGDILMIDTPGGGGFGKFGS
ncbi:5-oxoprolinase-like [Condylostylus longicornis]|uniref:5-oxoprolinase-like n=1 Tax=Condylostylus longicornis TaxID=2530218 RepID=UPI00244E17C0|nr:5-oxoprolinase-like [Condylostylus longicornis]